MTTDSANPDTAQPTAPESTPLRAYLPTTISPEAAAIYARYRPLILSPRRAPPQSLAEFDARYEAGEQQGLALSEARVRALESTVIERDLGGVQAFEIRPKGWQDDGTAIIQLHGGGFVLGSARSSLGEAAGVAQLAGKRVFNVEYTVAPRGNWKIATDQVMTAYKTLLGEGLAPEHLGVSGGSAGASIAASATLKIRDHGLPLPAALVLLCPMSDFTEGGDTRATLMEADPALWAPEVRAGLDAYADPADQKHPYVSPVYGDFSQGYPPTLIQGGTKEWLLSDMVRLSRAIRRGGGHCELEIHEGMPHGFMGLMADAPEGKEALAEQLSFWRRHLPAAT